MSIVSVTVRAVACALLLFILLSETVAAQPPHTFAGENGLLVFESERESASNDSSLFVGFADGLGARRLTASPGYDERPAFSPDGTRVAFVRTIPVGDTYASDLYVIRTDGTGLRALTTDGLSKHDFSWSSDGTRLAYVDEQSDLHVVNTDGTGNVLVLGATPEHAVQAEPVWSPDSTRIAFASLDVTGADGTTSVGRTNIFTVSPDGTGLFQASDVPDSVYASHARYSADGTFIAYRVSEIDLVPEFYLESSVWVMYANGTKPHRITPWNSAYDEELLDWSHSSNRILFDRVHRATHARTTWTMLPAGDGRLQAVTAPDAREPSLSPNGLRVLHRRGGDGLPGDGRFVSVALDGTDSKTVNARPDHHASWSSLYGDVTGKDVLWLDIDDGLSYDLEAPLETGSLDRVITQSVATRYRFVGTGTVRTPLGGTATVTFNMWRAAPANAAWQGTLRVLEPGVLDRIFDMSSADVDFATGAGRKTWLTWKQICGPLTCFQIPILHAVAFRIDDRT